MKYRMLVAGIMLVCMQCGWSHGADEIPDTPMEAHVPMRAITSGPAAHWFAYYDKYQFDPSDRYALGMQVAFETRTPQADDAVILGMIDLQENDRWTPFAESTAWC